MEMGFRALAAPTARQAAGRPRSSRSPHRSGSPRTGSRRAHARHPSEGRTPGRSGRSKSVRSPSNQRAKCRGRLQQAPAAPVVRGERRLAGVVLQVDPRQALVVGHEVDPPQRAFHPAFTKRHAGLPGSTTGSTGAWPRTLATDAGPRRGPRPPAPFSFPARGARPGRPPGRRPGPPAPAWPPGSRSTVPRRQGEHAIGIFSGSAPRVRGIALTGRRSQGDQCPGPSAWHPDARQAIPAGSTTASAPAGAGRARKTASPPARPGPRPPGPPPWWQP